MTKVTDYLKENQATLDLYTTAITRAHGAHHPEVFQVKALYDSISQKLTETTENPDLSATFAQLRELTADYQIPDDVCPTFTATYQMLAKADSLQEATEG